LKIEKNGQLVSFDNELKIGQRLSLRLCCDEIQTQFPPPSTETKTKKKNQNTPCCCYCRLFRVDNFGWHTPKVANTPHFECQTSRQTLKNLVLHINQVKKKKRKEKDIDEMNVVTLRRNAPRRSDLTGTGGPGHSGGCW
jgi:hypothetical protein